MPDLGLRLQLLIGPTVPLPAPFAVMDALANIEVTNRDLERDGFQMTFTLGKDSVLDYGLLLNGYFDPPARVIIVAIINALPQVVIDGLITSHQVIPSNKPGDSKLVVTGEDISLQLDLEEKSVTFPNQPDSVIVTRLIGNYATYGLLPVVTDTTDTPIQTDRVPSQQITDLTYIQKLAERNGFVFYIEPTMIPGKNTAYWGVDNRLGIPQPPLTLGMGPDTNVDAPINFSFNALGPAAPQITIVDPTTKLSISIPIPSSLRPPLASQPAPSLRKTIARDTANLSPIQAALRALSSSGDSSDAISGTGQLDSVRYGRVLQARRLVSVRGAGYSYDGSYYVKEVTHHIERGKYKQNFTLKREGRGALSPSVIR
jgi:hypothetical protein